MATAAPPQLPTPPAIPAQLPAPAQPPAETKPEHEEPRLTYRSQRKFEMRSTSFGKSVDKDILKWVGDQIEAREKQLRRRHKNLVPEWRRIASGKPREEDKSWPFENCSNLVHPIVGESSDELSARVLQLIWAIAPIIKFSYFNTSSGDTMQALTNAQKAKLLERFMDYVAYEPNELDLYPVENLWFHDSANIGTAWTCVAPEQRVEMVHIGYDKENGGNEFKESELYKGPKVLNLRDEDVFYDPDANKPEESVIIGRKISLNRRDLQERVFFGHYKKAEVEKILNKPDRYGPGEERKRENAKKGIEAQEDRILAEWDVYEWYASWYVGRKKYRLIGWFHKETKTMLNQVFNFIPENQIPLVRTRLTMGEHGMNGRGFADMGSHFQDEISTAKNMRNDATMWMMLGINTISPQNRNIDKNLKTFPGAMLPVNKDEFMHHNVGSPDAGQLSMSNEQAMIQQARERFGVGPPLGGMGAGTTNKKGQYGSMGTMAVLQEGNARNNHRTSDFRHAHVRLFSLVTDMYGAMGFGRKGADIGLDEKLLEKVFTDWLERRVRMPIRSSSPSANREVAKQNEMLLNPALDAYVKAMSTAIQALMREDLPPFYKKWLKETALGKVRLMQQIVADFQLSDNPEEFVPNIDFPAEGQQPHVAQAPQQKPGLPAAGLEKMAELIRGRSSSAVPSGVGGLPPTNGGPSTSPLGVGG
jgi:hypothetical protein